MQITVIKQDIHGQETWRYSGRLLHKTSEKIVIEAFFDRQDMAVHGLPLCQGDRFVETYYLDRWYNAFAVHSREDDSVRGWYCNITRPAWFDGQKLSYIDLALDLIVFPDRRQVVVDEADFEALPLSPGDRARARAALAELQSLFREGVFP
jgi:protein associated with RNAse G/E